LAELGEEVHVAAQSQERQSEHVQHHRRRGGGCKEERACRGDDKEEQHVAATALHAGPGVDSSARGALRVVRAVHVCLAMRRVAAAVRAERGLARTIGLTETVGGTSASVGRAVQRRLAMVSMARTTAGRRALQRRRGERATERADARCRRALQGAELASEVGDRRIRSVLDTRAQHRRDQNSCPSGSDDEEDELGHESEWRWCSEFVWRIRWAGSVV